LHEKILVRGLAAAGYFKIGNTSSEFPTKVGRINIDLEARNWYMFSITNLVRLNIFNRL
jgi:hypothetical protein